MFDLFNRSPIDRDMRDWIIEKYAFLARSIGPAPWHRRLPLILPTLDFFPRNDAEGHAKAEWLFETVKRLMEMGLWECELEALPDDIDVKVSEVFYLQTDSQPGGVFVAEKEGAGDSAQKEAVENQENDPGEPVTDDVYKVKILYNPSSIKNPSALISIFAHELSHYLLHWRVPQLPDHNEEELLTDLCTIFCGFGVFAANSAFSTEHGADGSYRLSSQGYFTAPSIVFALALFCRVNDVAIETVKEHLNGRFWRLFQKCLKHLDKNPQFLTPIRKAYP